MARTLGLMLAAITMVLLVLYASAEEQVKPALSGDVRAEILMLQRNHARIDADMKDTASQINLLVVQLGQLKIQYDVIRGEVKAAAAKVAAKLGALKVQGFELDADTLEYRPAPAAPEPAK